MTLIFNRKKQKPRRQQLRNNATSAERILWRCLKGSQVAGVKFRRQHGVGPYIMDFFSNECMLAIEVDGVTHSSAAEIEHDRKREKFISSYGIKTIRFSNDDVYANLEGVIATIEEIVLGRRSEMTERVHPSLPSKRGGVLSSCWKKHDAHETLRMTHTDNAPLLVEEGVVTKAAQRSTIKTA